jgi:SulP family sulfate permease
LLGAVESLLSAVVADGMIGSRHRANMELVAQGVANIASPLFGGMPATGAIARTATNIRNGGRTPVAGIVHAITLLLITLFFGRWAGLIPLATLAAILVVVAYHMSEWRTFRDELHAPKSDVAVLLVTFFLTVVVDLTVAIEVGMILSAFLFMHRMSEVTAVNAVTQQIARESREQGDIPLAQLTPRSVPTGVEVFEISGAFFFGAAEAFKETLTQVAGKPKVLIIRMRDVSLLDATGLRALRDVVRRSKAERTLVLVAEIHAQPLAALKRSQLYGELGEGQIYMTLEDALDRAREHMVTRHPTPVTAFPSAKR